MKNKKIVVNSLALALGIGVLAPAANSVLAGGSDLSPLISQAYAAEENVDDKKDQSDNGSDNVETIDDKQGVETDAGMEFLAESEIKFNTKEEPDRVVMSSNDIDPNELLSEAKFDEDMSIDDPATYDYAGYIIKHYNPTNEEFMEKRNSVMFVVLDELVDNTDNENTKTLEVQTVVNKGKDLSEKVNAYINELEKHKGDDSLDISYEGLEGSYYFDHYLDGLYLLYNSTNEGVGNGHEMFDHNGNLFASDFSIENFKEIIRNPNIEGISTVAFDINDSFRNKPIIWANQIFLGEDQYFQYKDAIIDVLKSETDFKNMTSRKTKITPQERAYYDVVDNDRRFPNNIKKIAPNNLIIQEFNIYYDKQNILDADGSIYLKKNSDVDLNPYLDKDITNDDSFSLFVDFQEGIPFAILPAPYYLSRSDKPIFKADGNLAFKEKSDVTGSEWYIANTAIDRDDVLPSIEKYVREIIKDNEDFNKMSKEEQETAIQKTIKEMLPDMLLDIDEKYKDNATNIKKYQDFLNSDKWGNQRLTQYIGNVDTKVEEKDFKVIEKEDPELAKGETKVLTEGVKGKKVTKITYKVNRINGELTDPVEEVIEDIKPVDKVVLVGTKEVTLATPIEDIAKTTKTTKEVIKAKVQYEADEELAFEEQIVDKAPVDGEKEITTVSQSGKEDVVTEDVIKEPEDGKTRVGNKKVETKTNEDGSTTTTTTIYDVDPDTGELVNPRSTSKTTMPATPIEDIAKTTKKTKEVIKAKVQYEADEELAFEEQVIDKAPVDGEKEITAVSQSGKEDVVTEDIIKEPEDGKTRVGNKKVEVKNNDDGSVTTTTTIYDVNPDTGELENPKSTSTTVKKPQNELYEPEGVDQTTNIGKPLKPEDFITNIKDLPEDTKFEFEEQPDFDKPGESKVKIVATYPDGTKDTVESKLTVNDVEKPSTSNKTNVTPNTIKPATTAAPTRTSVKAQTGGGVGAIGGLIAGLTAAASSIFKRRKK